MQADDVRALRQCAVTTAVVGVAGAVVGGVADGSQGVLGAVIALAVVCVFFLVSFAALRRAAKVGPQAMMPVALGTYLGKIVVLVVLVALFRNSTVFNGRVFGLTAVACVLAWTGAQARLWMTDRTFRLDPVPAAKANLASQANSASQISTGES